MTACSQARLLAGLKLREAALCIYSPDWRSYSEGSVEGPFNA